jgi:hypothetical protein
MSAHKDIRIRFTVEGRNFEAVGFLKEDDVSGYGDKMLRHTAGENGGAIGDEDEAFLRERLQQLPKSLQYYNLMTNRRRPGYPQHVSYFGFSGNKWGQHWDGLGHFRRRDHDLVVRRCS